MKIKINKDIIFGALAVIIGLFISLGPMYLFKVCGHSERSAPRCYWSAQAELGLGFLITALGACVIVFADAKIRLGLFTGIFFAGIISLAIPNMLIGGCNGAAMACRAVAFPALTIESAILLALSAAILTITALQIKKGKG